ncbi:MAG: hypothetical protein HZB85_08870 [Deltaproteobacteria bacterium]|nr:hypothetical protein [Deltaproteobacteria bacterium]
MSHDMTSIDGGIGRRVSAAWRLALVIAIVSTVLFFFPQSAIAKYRDLYQHTTLNGSVGFVYNKGEVRSKRYQRDDSGFRQVYSLNMRGKVKSSKYFIYDASVLHNRNAIKSRVGNSNTTINKLNTTTYRFNSTFLRRSAIPLTLRLSRNTADSSGNSRSHSVRDAYGLDWSFKFKDLPEIHTSYDITRTKSSGRASDSTQQFRLLVRKNIGVTDNSFSAQRVNIKSPTSGNSALTSLNYSNSTYLSKNTQMNANAAKNSSSSNQINTSATSVDMSLYSKPSADFSQSHNYSFQSTKARTTNESTLYSGSIRFNVTERLSTSLHLNTYSHSTVIGAERQRTNRTESADSINYRLTRRLTWATTASYLADRNNAPNANRTGANRTRYQLLTGLNYRRVFEYVTTTASYRFGYLEEKSSVVGKAALRKKRGMTQGVSLGLSKMRLWDYALMNTSYQYSQAKNMISDSFTDTTFYAADITNTAGRKYVRAKASYNKKIEDSWVRALNKKSEAYGINLSTRYFARSSGSVSYSRINTYAELAAKTSTSEMNASAMTQRKSFAGDTTLELEVGRSKVSQSNADNLSGTALERLNVKHEFSVLKKTVFGFSMRRFASSRNKRVLRRNNKTELDLSHKRRIFGGSFSADYSLLVIKNIYFAQQENYKTHKIESHYSRSIGNKLSGALSVSKSKSTGTFLYSQLPDETEVGATVYYTLRSWLLSLEYSNKTSKYTYDTIKSNRLMLSLSRQFVREW